MSKTGIEDVQEQVQKKWSPIFEKELRENTVLPSIVSKDYEGEITKGGDTVYITQINKAEGQIRTIGVDADTFESEPLSKQRIALVVNKRITTSFEFDDLNEILSQIDKEDSEIRGALVAGIEEKLNTYLYSLVSPSTATPDHVIGTVTDFKRANLGNLRKLAGQAKWRKDKQWYALLDPSYYVDIMNDITLTSSDYANDNATIKGEVVAKRYNFNLVEDNSDGMLTHVSDGGVEDACLACYADFMHVALGSVNFKISDLHPNKQFGFLISANMLLGAVLGNDGDVKHITVNAKI